ncbi:MAG: hypothetical protein GEU73_05095 [Chloroflexi bacterium]|nr:hypothetical protein [Chloroflexota bacterium]
MSREGGLMRYGVIVCIKEGPKQLDFATREVADEGGVLQAWDDLLQSDLPQPWRFFMVCHIEDMPLIMQGFVPTGASEGPEVEA